MSVVSRSTRLQKLRCDLSVIVPDHSGYRPVSAMSVVQPNKTLYVLLPVAAAFILWAAVDFSNYLVERQLLASKAMEAIREASNAHDIVDAIIGKARARLSPVDHGDNFLRATALDSWVKGEGQCGDAARVIVLMLRSVGIDAGRVYLRAEPENYFHVASRTTSESDPISSIP